MTSATHVRQPSSPTLVAPSGLLLGDAYLRWLALVLLGYALAGRSFAYLGVGPVYVGEITLGLGLAVALATRSAFRIPRSPTVGWLLALLAWGTTLTAIDFQRYGFEAARDAVIWAYATFALIVAGLLVSRPTRLVWLLAQYRRFARVFPVLIPVVWLVYMSYRDVLPVLPGTDIPVLQAKPTDILVHLAGIGSFQILGMAPAPLSSLLAFSVALTLTAVRTRGGTLAFVVALALIALARPLRRRLWLALVGGLAAITLLLSLDTGLAFRGRELSAGQLVANLRSIVETVDAAHLDGPKRWRLQWWSEIVDYTLRGPYFWLGKGFGPNLATTDGFDLDESRSLRSPHNAHLTMLARAGVPGLALWLLVQLSWLRQMCSRYRESRRARHEPWARLFLFLIAYWVAFMTNATFDVYLEGPMGGIWFWTVFGTGMAAVSLYRRVPGLLLPHPVPAPPPLPKATRMRSYT